MPENPKYSFIVPAYNEEINIPLLYERIKILVAKLNESWELIFINDGSKDNTLSVLKDLVAKDTNVKYIDLSRNFGQQAALTAGYEHALGEAIISLDCDLQDPPEVIEEMIKEWKSGFNIVYARRRKRNDRFLKKYSAILYYKILYQFSETKIPRNIGDFRLIDRKVLNEINQMKERSRYLRGMVAWVGFKHTFVDFDRPERTQGQTNYTLKKMITLSMDGLINFSSLPLKLGLFLGGGAITLGFLFLLYMIIDIIINNVTYPLYKWLVVVLFIFLGFNFVLIWLLGEYISRIYNESKDRPYYIVNEKENFNEDINV